jgi:hypothetical protein
MSDDPVVLTDITSRIFFLRGTKVLLDADLALLYGVQTRRLNEQVRRNLSRFPEDFILELNDEEFASLKSHFATSSWGGRRKLPLAFTEHGAIMAATVLKSPRAIEVSVYVVRAFIQLRELVGSHKELALRLDALERKTELMAAHLNNNERETRMALKQLFNALRELTAVPPPAARPPIGFINTNNGEDVRRKRKSSRKKST